jgi:LytS/YehU family sensor histidine kinase
MTDKQTAKTATNNETNFSKLWWQFFDWVAVVSWPKMVFLCFFAFVFAGMLHLPSIFYLAILATIVMKVLAGGKRRAEIAANVATERANVEALERRLLEAQVAVLQAQVEPHFLFNTLALIGQYIETDPPEAARIHKHLIEYLRAAIPQMRASGGTTLAEQINLSRAYLNIMQARMKERLRVVIEVPSVLNDARFPPMMLQSVVENAIKHGLEPKLDGGEIRISARLADGDLVVEVADNGAGFNLHAKDGVGLANIRERLKILYGGKAQLVIEIPPHGGTAVAIHVPYNHQQ